MRHLRILLGLILPALLGAPAMAQQRSPAGPGPYVDPVLRSLLRPEVRVAAEGALAPRAGPAREEKIFGDALALDRAGPSGAPRVGVLMRLRAPAAESLAKLQARGVEIGTVVGDIATARVPLDALEALSGAYELERIEAARTLRFAHDSSLVSIRVHQVRQREGSLWFGSAGYGVVVGIYDTGIDYRHDDFRDGAGRSRILAIWDQTATGSPSPGFAYGRLCDAASIDSGSCPQRDLNGHGTHVAGSAAGDGSASGNGEGTAYRYAGVAPAAELMVVKGGEDGFDTDRIVDGVDWIFRTTAALGRPAAVNLSLGGQFGPRDGSTLFEQALDRLSGPGRIIVTAAGNDGANDNTEPRGTPALFHGMDLPSPGATREFRIEVPSYAARSGTCDDFALIELWYRVGDVLDLTVLRPDGTGVTAAAGSIQAQAHPGGRILIDNASAGPDPRNGDHEAYLEISDCGGGGPPQSGTWTLRVVSRAASGEPFHLWISASRFGTGGTARGVSDNFTNSHVIANPGSAREVVTVGAFVSRHCWPTARGGVCYTAKEALGDIARFSGGGPTRDGRLKPEIAAPGMAIVSALSRDAPNDSVMALLTTPDGAHWAIQGTSMAAPHVSGAIALLLQHAPQLSPPEVKALLARTAAQDAHTTRSYTGGPGGTPNDQWGHGKLDVAAAVAELDILPPATLLVEPSPAAATETAASAQGARLPLLRLRLRTVGEEPMRLLAAAAEVSGEDPAARLLLIDDRNGNGRADPGEGVVAETRAALRAGEPTTVELLPRGLDIAPGDSAWALVVLELSGNTPNHATFAAVFDPQRTRAVGLRTGARRDPQPPGTPVAARPVRTTLLQPGEVFALSENPVRSDRVIFSFRERPRLAGIYTLGGGRVVDLVPRIDGDGRVVWNLSNDQGGRVAPGIYLLVFDVGGTVVRRKLIIVRPA